MPEKIKLALSLAQLSPGLFFLRRSLDTQTHTRIKRSRTYEEYMCAAATKHACEWLRLMCACACMNLQEVFWGGQLQSYELKSEIP